MADLNLPHQHDFAALYTHQKQKKAKVWQDGFLIQIDSSKRHLLDAKKNRLDTVYSSLQVTTGDELETDKYLITVEDEMTTSSTSSNDTQTGKSATRKLSIVKKTRKGFVPPRRMSPLKLPPEMGQTYEKLPPEMGQTSETVSNASSAVPTRGLFSAYGTGQIIKRPSGVNHCQTMTEKRMRTNHSEDISPFIVDCSSDHRSACDILQLIAPESVDERSVTRTVDSLEKISHQPDEVAGSVFTHVALADNSNFPSVEKPLVIATEKKSASTWDNYLTQHQSNDEEDDDAEDDIAPDSTIIIASAQLPMYGKTTPLVSGNALVERPHNAAVQSEQLAHKLTDLHQTSNTVENQRMSFNLKPLLNMQDRDLPNQNQSPRSGIKGFSALVDESPQQPSFAVDGAIDWSDLSQMSQQTDNVKSQKSVDNASYADSVLDTASGHPISIPTTEISDPLCVQSLKNDMSSSVTLSNNSHPYSHQDCASQVSQNEPSDVVNSRTVPDIRNNIYSISYGLLTPDQEKSAHLQLDRGYENIDIHSDNLSTDMNVFTGALNETSELDLDLDSPPIKKPVAPTMRNNGESVWSAFTASPMTASAARDSSIFTDQSSIPASRQIDVLLSTILPVNEDSHIFADKLPQTSSAKHELPDQPSAGIASLVQQYKTDLPSACESRTNRVVDCLTLRFPPDPGASAEGPQRCLIIPTRFSSSAEYKQTMEKVLREYVNIMLFELSRHYHDAMREVDLHSIDQNSPPAGNRSMECKMSRPICDHKVPTATAIVKREGRNQGRQFYCCAQTRSDQCTFFQWVQESGVDLNSPARQVKLTNPRDVDDYLKRSKDISFYCQCQILYTSQLYNAKKNWKRNCESSSVLYLKLPRRERAASYSKGDLWVVSQSYDFGLAGHTFLAMSVFFGPNTENELELKPLAGYTNSCWPEGVHCHAIHAVNVSTELTCLAKVGEVTPRTLPLLPHLLNDKPLRQTVGKFSVPLANSAKGAGPSIDLIDALMSSLVQKYQLNDGQNESLRCVADMFKPTADGQSSRSVTIIKGVFGAGKSYLLSVVVIFLVQILASIEEQEQTPAKILIAALTNVAVDRVLLGLLDQDFTDFIRVGSMKKIAKPILPHSVHATGVASHELRELQDIMKEPDLSSQEKGFVRRGIEKHRLGINKQRLKDIRVVGVTCAACSFPVLDGCSFKIALLDECSQMTEPVSLLPLCRASCEKLILVGDPRQLPPTIQGGGSNTSHGLEQTLFDRLSRLCHTQTQLCVQYRCHPLISALCNRLFYDDQLEDGVSEEERPPLVDGLPHICMFSVAGVQKYSSTGNSFYNDKEAAFINELITWLLKSGVNSQQIGVITLYRAQVTCIKSALGRKLTSSRNSRNVQVSTVDSFQGAERDIIILSTVRTEQMGFCDDVRRANVALSRGRNHLLLVGHHGNLRRNQLWSKVIEYLSGCPDGIQPSSRVSDTWFKAV